ncbi:MAG TPA: alpha/beta fold hydrolase [Aestuariivirgaceae bacterium]|jgi:class 3 adenylate cyclase/pimeloyl-ACP methyl ester carboxylesterase
MAEENLQRRLVAILAADVAGYSRMMSEDEPGTLAALQRCRSELIEPAIIRHQGRVVKLLGDGLLVEFSSVVKAVACAAEFQREIAARNAGAVNKPLMIFRVGVHLGDIIVDRDDIYGDGVNIAARLEGIALPGGICISRQAYDQVHKKLALGYTSLGPQKLKNIPERIEVFAINGDGLAASDDRQEIRYCRAPDGVRLAYAISGQGPPLIKAANWLNHLEYDWDSPIWHHFLAGLSKDHTLIRYDARGNGLSDWDVAELSFEAWVNDLQTVVEATGLKRFPLFGISQGCAISITYAVRHPEQVSHLILLGGFALGPNKRSPQEAAKRKALVTLTQLEWGANSPTIRQLFTTALMPDATKQQADSFNELQRRTTSAECAARYLSTTAEFDVTALLSQVTAPTLVMHARDDAQVPMEAGRQMAAGIPGAKFVVLQGNNHIPLEQDPATQRIFEEIRLFLA